MQIDITDPRVIAFKNLVFAPTKTGHLAPFAEVSSMYESEDTTIAVEAQPAFYVAQVNTYNVLPDMIMDLCMLFRPNAEELENARSYLAAAMSNLLDFEYSQLEQFADADQIPRGTPDETSAECEALIALTRVEA